MTPDELRTTATEPSLNMYPRETLASLLAAGAAVAAAVLAAVNLYISTRQERVRWLRDSLLDTYQSFLGARFDWGDAAKGAYGRSPTMSDLDEHLPTVRERVGQTHSEQVQALTRLRLLAGPDAVRAADPSRLLAGLRSLAPNRNLSTLDVRPAPPRPTAPGVRW